jgi:ABC-2 type transport system ATP-binding protein
MNFIEAQGVIKNYGQTRALDNFSLQVGSGEVMALLGPNGAGKTTFVKAMLGLVRIQAGSIQLMGVDHQTPIVRQRVAYLPERFSTYRFERVDQVLTFFGRCRGLKSHEISGAINVALERVGIPELSKRKMKTLSKGQTQRVGVASLLMGPVEAMILDEPFSGIDPIATKELKVLLMDLKAEGKTLFINSHILSEMEKICDSVAIVHKGQCLASGSLATLTQGKSLEDYFYTLIKPTESSHES